ncbi:hypothetical protein N3Z16_10780 (plasmid) [Candidatus Megaera polyxenophila]|nr:hypothetical protein N3Z16_10780 [Candidatus Megaera polyxenophila]
MGQRILQFNYGSNVTDDMINEYINKHTDAHETDFTSNNEISKE